MMHASEMKWHMDTLKAYERIYGICAKTAISYIRVNNYSTFASI